MINLKIDTKKHDTEYQELRTYLIKKLPSKIMGWNSKKEFGINREVKETHKQLFSKKWIMYNKSWVNLLWIDIDDNKNGSATNTIDSVLNMCIDKLDLEPTIALKTDHGVQIAFGLENRVKESWGKAFKFLKDIKQMLTELLNADPIASHRNIGAIFRNPLQHDFYFSNVEYSLNDFKDLLRDWREKRKSIHIQFKNVIRKKKNNEQEYNFVIGQRNTYLFRSGMRYSKNTNMNVEEIFTYLNQLQHTFPSVAKLDKNSLMGTAKSINKYNKNGKNNFSKIEKEVKKVVNEGIMEFEKIKNLNFEDYKIEVKRRQKLSANRTNSIIENEEEKRKMRVENIIKKNIERGEAVYNKVVNIITGNNSDSLKKKNGTWNAKKISVEYKIDPRVVRKYIKRYEEENPT